MLLLLPASATAAGTAFGMLSKIAAPDDAL
jgi:hypothetical protein